MRALCSLIEVKVARLRVAVREEDFAVTVGF
jgi:hypothetical protein